MADVHDKLRASMADVHEKRSVESLEIDFLISRMKENVNNHLNLRPRQIVELSFVEFLIDAASSSSHRQRGMLSPVGLAAGGASGADVGVLLQNMQKEWRQQNHALLQRLQLLVRGPSKDDTPSTDRDAFKPPPDIV